MAKTSARMWIWLTVIRTELPPGSGAKIDETAFRLQSSERVLALLRDNVVAAHFRKYAAARENHPAA